MINLIIRSFSRRAGVLAAIPSARVKGTTARLRKVKFDGAGKQAIHAAAERYGLPVSLITAVLADEQVRLDASDRIQNVLIHLCVAMPQSLESTLWRWSERLAGRSVQTFSLGRAQMKFGTLQRLGELGYLDVPAYPEAQLRLLLDPLAAPHLVAACLRATADHWAARGVPILHCPDILGTLYSLGFEGRQGVHSYPQASERGELIAAHARWLEEWRIEKSEFRITGQA